MKSLGRYEVVELLGRGSMGAVYRAWDPMMDREVAIKTIQTHALEGPRAAEFRDRFFREAKAAGKLAHPGIVTVFDVSEHEGMPFLVMEYVPGLTLESLPKKKDLDLDQVCDFGIQLAEALDYAHRSGVVHRDIKPANVLVTESGRIKIADFGVAKLTGSSVTLTGQLLGTPAFMAPEQFTGPSVDGRADLFAMSVVIYWMATGDRPFTGDTAISVQYKVMQMEPVRPRQLNPAISPSMEALILKGMEKDPARRYQSGEELAHDLRELKAGRPVSPTVTVIKPVKEQVARKETEEKTELLIAERLEPKPMKSTHSTMRFSAAAARSLVNWRPIAFSTLLATVFALSAFTLIRTAKATPPVVLNEAVVPDTSTPAPPPVARVVEESPHSVALPPPRPVSSPEPESAKIENVKTVSAPARSPVSQPKLNPFNSAELLITSLDLPDPLSVIVTADNELLLNAESVASSFRSAVPLAEVRTLPPGEHKLQVNVMRGTRRVGRPQEITARFFAGKRRTLQISFLPAGQSIGRDGKGFTITLK